MPKQSLQNLRNSEHMTSVLGFRFHWNADTNQIRQPVCLVWQKVSNGVTAVGPGRASAHSKERSTAIMSKTARSRSEAVRLAPDGDAVFRMRHVPVLEYPQRVAGCQHDGDDHDDGPQQLRTQEPAGVLQGPSHCRQP